MNFFANENYSKFCIYEKHFFSSPSYIVFYWSLKNLHVTAPISQHLSIQLPTKITNSHAHEFKFFLIMYKIM